MKICIVGNEYKQQFPLLGYGGIESCVENLVIGLDKYFKDKIKFCVFVPKILDKKETKYNFNVIETNYIESGKSHVPAEYFALEVANLIKQGNIRPDVIWCQSAWAHHLADLGIPVICTIHDSGGWVNNKFYYKPNLHYRFISKYQYDLVFENADTDDYINKIKTNSFWCYTGVSDEEYEFDTAKENYNLWVGGLNWGFKSKGLELFVKMAKHRPDQQFIAYGAGICNEEPDLNERIKKLSEEIKNFDFMGPLKRGEYHRKIFKKAKLFVFQTQITEAFGRTGLEAITKGTPVLCSTKGAAPELYSPISVCTDDFNEMVACLDTQYDYNEIYKYSQKFHIKNEINFLIKKSEEIVLI
jgi:glycosyltransferase involved in cell wall biosynthesis